MGREAAQETFSVSEHGGNFLDGVVIDVLVGHHLLVIRALTVCCDPTSEPLKPPEKCNLAFD